MVLSGKIRRTMFKQTRLVDWVPWMELERNPENLIVGREGIKHYWRIMAGTTGFAIKCWDSCLELSLNPCGANKRILLFAKEINQLGWECLIC